MAVQDNTETLSLPFFNPHECLDFMEFVNGSLHQKQHHVLQQPKQQKILNALSQEFVDFMEFQGFNESLQQQQQQREIDLFLLIENERFRLVLQRLIGQHTSTVLKNFESRVSYILNKKDEEITKANTKMIELVNYVWKLETEKQLWQRTAWEAEAAVVTLNNALQRVKESDDASSECCSSSDDRTVADARTTEGMVVVPCRVCASRDSCMLMIPCRHLCCCRTCDDKVQLCPVCSSAKNCSIEVFF
ncbi:hypothetical protein QJS04_geneDACA009637 [Acorus gramineus]|uniref:RING-type domain-containing protein n=1 Tax=Acorus gramineus TaxID=55184 RepID=A0AAV9B852_ACOGR|nr:hypothetical protein QJS04_geneDACA009637 [Acorus gramineus]